MNLFLLALFLLQLCPSIPLALAFEDAVTEEDNPVHDKDTSDNAKHATYVIGDLHGDFYCAYYWILQTGLIGNMKAMSRSSSSYVDYEAIFQEYMQSSNEWTWTDPSSSLVFLGDYIDKGPTSYQTVRLVKLLTEKFSSHVVAIMGNHELELLLDRDPARKQAFGGHHYHQMAYAVVHPLEYYNFIPKEEKGNANDGNQPLVVDDEDDRIALNALMNATLQVYAQSQHSSVYFIPSTDSDSSSMMSRSKSIIDYVQPPSIRDLVSKRLQVYQKEYMQAFRSNTELGQWLEQRPIMHYCSKAKAVFVHGGIRPSQVVVDTIFSSAEQDGLSSSIQQFNTMVSQYFGEDNITQFMQQTTTGQVTYDLVTFRGNHAGYNKKLGNHPYKEALICQDYNAIFQNVNENNDVHYLAVGHTPGKSVRMSPCLDNKNNKNNNNVQFLALDSMLGRWIRSTGNMYCPGDKIYSSSSSSSSRLSSILSFFKQNKEEHYPEYVCKKISSTCQGQIIRISSSSNDGSDSGNTVVEILNGGEKKWNVYYSSSFSSPPKTDEL